MKRFGIALTIAMTLGLMLVGTGAANAAVADCYPNCTPTVGGSGNTITGGDWCPGSTVQVYIDGDFVGTAQVDRNGEFEFTVPSDIPSGEHEVTVYGIAGDCETSTSVTTTIQIGGEVAFTGSNISFGLVALVALFIVGVGALIAGRRRRGAEA